MILVLLASGRGSRCKNLTKNYPKCLIKVKQNKTILDYLEKSFELFNKIIIVTGYKSHLLEKRFANIKKIKLVKNKKYKDTNMVYSLFAPSKSIKEDIIVSYADIVYKPNLIKKLKKNKQSTIPLNENWLKTWKLRMSKKKIIDDAEEVEINKKYIVNIGRNISGKLPSVQYMGLLKIILKDYHRMKKDFYSMKNYKIDMTNFINKIIKKKKIKFSYFKTKSKWYEFDDPKDVKNFKKLNF